MEHFFYQTSANPFFMEQQFNALQPYIDFLEYSKESSTDIFTLITHNVSEIEYDYYEVKEHIDNYCERFKYKTLNITPTEIHGGLTYVKLKSHLRDLINDIGIPQTLTVFNGEPFYSHDDELKVMSLYNHWKEAGNTPLYQYVHKDISNGNYSIYSVNMFILYIMIEEFIEHNPNFVVHNVMDDPMQHKLDYFTPSRIINHYTHLYENDKLVHGDKSYHVDYNPSIYYSLFDSLDIFHPFYRDVERELKFAFGMTDYWRETNVRSELIEFVNDNMSLDTWFAFKSNNTVLQTKVDFVSYETYIGKILPSATTTLIIPSHHTESFSVRRFTEAILVGTIPLVLDTCNYSEAFSNFPTLVEFITKYLVVSKGTLFERVDELHNNFALCNEIVEAYDKTDFVLWFKNGDNIMKHIRNIYKPTNKFGIGNLVEVPNFVTPTILYKPLGVETYNEMLKRIDKAYPTLSMTDKIEVCQNEMKCRGYISNKLSTHF